MVEWVAPEEVPRVVPGDADDDQVIAAALAGAAQMIVSGDAHLLAMGEHRGVSIRSPADALKLLQPSPQL